jgi:hypothetical protein
MPGFIIRAGLGAVLAVSIALVAGGEGLRPAQASINTISAVPGSVVFPNTSTVTVNANESDGGNGPITVAVAAGSLTFVSCQTTVACSGVVVSGNGTASVTLSNVTDGDATTGEPVTLTFTFNPPNVVTGTSVPFGACQGTSCSVPALGTITVFPGSASSATSVVLSTSASSITCGNSVTVTATVTSNGVAVPDGTVVVFSANNGAGAVSALTSGGTASVLVPVPVGFLGTLIVTASSGGASDSIFISVDCNVAGPPANIFLNITPQTISCGSTASVIARVTDIFGNLVANNTIVSFSSSLGSITPTAPTIGGNADAVLTSFPAQPGTAVISVKAGDATAQGSVTITCAAAQPVAPTAAPTAVPPAVPTTAPSTGVRPPSTGDAGLK